MTLIVNESANGVSFRFNYEGLSRIVDNVTIETEHGTIIGFELRKGGKFSNKIKRYSLDKITQLVAIDPVLRTGPVLARPKK